MSASVADCLKRSKELENSSDSARLDTEVLLAHALNKNRTWLYTWPEKIVEAENYTAFVDALARRKAGEPIAHIIGEKEFWSLRLKVNADTLIPRPDTELLVECALEKLSLASQTILDLGTGTGAIALAIASERPESKVLGVDFKQSIVELAWENALANQISNIDFQVSNWFSNVASQKFHLIVSNPPYIAEGDPHLTQGDLQFEPSSALVAKNKGCEDLQTIIEQAKEFLLSGACLVLEHGFDQAELVQAMMQDAGYSNIETRKDLGGNSRVTLGKL